MNRDFLKLLFSVIIFGSSGIWASQIHMGSYEIVFLRTGIGSLVLAFKKAESIKGMENAVWQLIFSFLTVMVYLFLRQGCKMEISAEDWLPILLLGVVNTGIGCYCYFSSIGNLPMQTVAICSYIEPLSAVVLSAMLLGESMNGIQILGAILILGGAFFSEVAGNK